MRIVQNPEMVQQANSLIPRSRGEEVVVDENGNTQDIINEILKTDRKNFLFMRRFAIRLKGPTTQQTLVNVWNFVKFNIRYQVDELGVQQIKSSPAIWWSRVCDCKGYSLFIRSILKNLGIHSKFKFAGYDPSRDVTHVYVIVPRTDGTYMTLDGCMPGFNVEKPPVKVIIK